MSKNIAFRAALMVLAGCVLPAAAQDASQPPVELRPAPDLTQRQLRGSNNMIDEKREKQPSGLSNKLPPGSAAAEVKDTRVNQELREGGKQPLKNVISVDADMKVELDEVILGPLKGLAVEVKNNSDRPLIFHGDQATAVVPGGTIKCVSEESIEKIIDPVLTSKQRVKKNIVSTAVAGATIGGMPMKHGFEIQKGPVLDRYEKDEARRETEFSRFGDRIVWPNDSTKGVIYFATDATVSGAQLQIPISSLYDKSVDTSLGLREPSRKN